MGLAAADDSSGELDGGIGEGNDDDALCGDGKDVESLDLRAEGDFMVVPSDIFLRLGKLILPFDPFLAEASAPSEKAYGISGMPPASGISARPLLDRSCSSNVLSASVGPCLGVNQFLTLVNDTFLPAGVDSIFFPAAGAGVCPGADGGSESRRKSVIDRSAMLRGAGRRWSSLMG